MKNEIIRIYENKNIIIYKRIAREEKGIMPYFLKSKDDKDYLEFRNIRGVKAFIKSLTTQTT